MHQEIRDYSVRESDKKVLKFRGDIIASSTSFDRRNPRDRWVEFELYRTVGGSYVLSRVGVSSLYHVPDCAVVARNDLKVGELVATSRPCELCYDPGYSGPFCVEKNRYWAQVSDAPEAVLEALYKYDQDGTRYLTQVARRLITDAAASDKAIYDIYHTEYVR